METTNKAKNVEILKQGYSKFVRWFEILSIFSFFILAIFTLYLVRDYIIANPLSFIGFIFLGWLGADLLSGFFHWLFDTWGRYDWPILGKLFVRPFLEHHISPNGITEHDWIETNGANLFSGIVPLGITLLVTDSPSAILIALCTSFWLSLTNQFHKWSHQSKVPFYVTILQKLKIVISKEHHSKHHQGDFSQHYCITSGFLNNLLDKIGFFRILEKVVQFITKEKPRNNELP